MKNIVNDIKTEAEAEGYNFTYGPDEFLNYYATQTADLTSQEYILSLFPVITRSLDIANEHIVSVWACDITLMLGRKFEENAGEEETDERSSIDETYEQKEERRLNDLLTELNTFVENFICDYDYRLQSLRYSDQINQTDESIDFVRLDMTVTYDNAE